MKKRESVYLDKLMDEVQANQKLAFDPNRDFTQWKADVRQKFEELFGIDKCRAHACDENFKIEKEEQKDGYKQIRFTFDSEENVTVPCYLLIPDTKKKKYPLVITLQGHTSGFHISIREPHDDPHAYYTIAEGDFAVQAVRRGYAALAIEQRGMGSRIPQGLGRHECGMCMFEGNAGLLIGRPLLGGRIWDVHKAIDALAHFPMIDSEKIVCTGVSGGGTATYYSACFDNRIKIAAPSGAFCTFRDSIIYLQHCICNYVPNMYNYFDMQDLSVLIAPNRLLVISGKKDPIFLIQGVRDGFETVKAIYEKAGVPDHCQLVETPKAHNWSEQATFRAIASEMKKLGW